MLCQYNNIYTSLHKYLKEKRKKNKQTNKQTNTNRLHEKRKYIAIVATVPLGIAVTIQNLGKKVAHETKALYLQWFSAFMLLYI